MKELWNKCRYHFVDVVQIVLFIFLIWIDLKRCSGTGDEWAAANQNIWWITASFVLLHYGMSAVKKWWVPMYLGTTLLFLILIRIFLWNAPYVPFIELSLTTVNIGVIGWATGVFILDVYRRFVVKDRQERISFDGIWSFCRKNKSLVAGILFLFLAAIMKDDLHKPFETLCIFSFLFSVPFTREEKKRLAGNLIWGIMAGFWLQQMFAFGFRPYMDGYIRYRGMYYNSNIYALLCLTVLVLTLVKLHEVRMQKGWKGILHIFLVVQYCMTFSLIVFSIGRITILLAGGITVLYLFYVFMESGKEKRKNAWKQMVLYVVLLGLVFPGTYLSIRYLPVILKHPVEFHDEYYLRGDLNNPDDYVSPEEFAEESLGRLAKLWNSYGGKSELENKLDKQNEENGDKKELVPIDPDWENTKYYLDYENGYNAIELRLGIWLSFLDDTNLTGHTLEESTQYITPYKAMMHAHNIFVQMIFSYGIIAGLVFIAWIVLYYIKAWKHLKENKGTAFGMLPLGVLILVTGFGFVELNWQLGQITWYLLIFTQLFMIQKPAVGKCDKTNLSRQAK